MSKVFLDTNILIYTVDKADPIKYQTTQALLRSLKQEGQGVLSTQILQEFYTVCVSRLGRDPVSVKNLLHLLRSYEVVVVDSPMIEDAVDCSILNRLSFWDALVIVAAEKAHCEKLLTEDLNHGQIIRGVRVENPFYRDGIRVHHAGKR